MLQFALYFKRLGLACGLGLALLSGILLALHTARMVQARPLSAPSTFIVDRVDDANSAAAWVCSAAANDCSLRGALISADANPGSIIQLPEGVVTITLSITPTGANDAASGDLNVTADVTVTHAPSLTCLRPQDCHTTIR